MNPPASGSGIERLAGLAGTSQIGVCTGADRWLVEVSDVSEIIPVPPLSSVPFTRRWFLGVFALRGGLVGVVDLAAFGGKPALVPSERNRLVLVSPKHGVNAAILVDHVIGPQNPEHFTREQPVSAPPSWIESIYRDPEERAWYALDMRALVEHRAFLEIEAAP